MAQPSTRSELITYAKRQLGAPVLEINVADEQVEDILDDAIQFFQERHFDGVYPTFLKYEITEDDIKRGRSRGGNTDNVGITSKTATSTIDGQTVSFSFNETSNYLQVPPDILGITKVFHFDGSNRMSSGMFSLKYQLFLNDIYYYGSTELLSYAMTKTYLEDINFLLTTQKQIRFNKRQDRLYLDIDWSSITDGEFLVIDCYRTLDPNDYARVFNDSFLKYEITEDDIKRGRSRGGNTDNVGITTQTATSTIDGQSVSFSFNETSNYLQVPPDILGITKVFHFDGSNRMSSGMFSLKYQLFLNDIYYYGSTELLSYAMTKTYLEDINFLLTTQKQIRFNKRQDRLYLDIDWSSITDGEFLVIDCYRTLDPNDYARVFNDSFLKRYFTALLKKQWGQNLIKFQGVKLPGGVELNGRQIYDDAMNDLTIIREQMSNTYELPPLDFIG